MKHAAILLLICCTFCYAAPQKKAKSAPQVAALQFGSLSLFDDYRKKVCAAYMKAAAPIYAKGDAVTDEEKTSFTEAAKELVRLRAYVGKSYSSSRFSLSPKGNESLREINEEKLKDAYAKMLAAEIKTDLPATREELNEASKYINALGQLMQLPVALR